MSGDDVRFRAAHVAASDALCRKVAEVAKYAGDTNDAMTVVLRTHMQAGQI